MQSIDWFDPDNLIEKEREKKRQNEKLQLALVEAQEARRQAAVDKQRQMAEDTSVPFDEIGQRIIERDGKKYKQQRWEYLYEDPVEYLYEEEEITSDHADDTTTEEDDTTETE